MELNSDDYSYSITFTQFTIKQNITLFFTNNYNDKTNKNVHCVQN